MRLTLSHGRINITLARHRLIKPGENNIVDQDIVYYLLKLDSFVKIDLFSDPFRKNVIPSKEDEQVLHEQTKYLHILNTFYL